MRNLRTVANAIWPGVSDAFLTAGHCRRVIVGRSLMRLKTGAGIPIEFSFEGSSLTAPPQELRQFVRGLLGRQYAGAQKRESARVRVAMSVAAVALDSDYLADGEPFVAMSIDISTRGIRLLHTDRVSAPFLLIRLERPDGQPIQMAMRVRRCRQLKRFVEIAGEFVTRCVPLVRGSADDTTA
jgi:PilZ domain